MLFLLGLFVMSGSIILGYLMHHGELTLLWQPNELVIILGAGIGASIIGNTLGDLLQMLKSLRYLFKVRPKSKNDYLELMSFFFNVFKLMKIKGMLEIESHLENPHESEIFNQSPTILKDHHALEFIKDYLRVMTMGVDNVMQFENLLDKELELYEEEEAAPGKILLTIGDSLPALGIVAAVLGVIVTMRSISEPPEVLGGLIAAALVGTFTGVLFAYGLFIPMGNYLKTYCGQKVLYIKCMKTAFLSHLGGNAPIITVEFMRKSIPDNIRPNFEETDQYINNRTKNFNQ